LVGDASRSFFFLVKEKESTRTYHSSSNCRVIEESAVPKSASEMIDPWGEISLRALDTSYESSNTYLPLADLRVKLRHGAQE